VNEACHNGVCGAAPKSPAASSAGPLFDLTPGKCANTESHPVMSLNTHLMFMSTGTSKQSAAWADLANPTEWTVRTDLQAAAQQQTAAAQPIGVPPYKAFGDQWSTTSGFNGEEYLALRTVDAADCSNLPSCANAPCPKSAVDASPISCNAQKQCVCTAGAPSEPALIVFEASRFTNAQPLPAAQYIGPLSFADDGLSVAFDPGGSALWQSARGVQNTALVVGFGPICSKGPVGISGTTCPQSSATIVEDAPQASRGHVTVIVNPCTHHALASLQEVINGQRFTVIKAINLAGKVVATWRAPACAGDSCNHPYNAPGSWGRHVTRPQLDVQFKGGVCRLLVGWENTIDLSGVIEDQAVLGAIDVTDESSGQGNQPGNLPIIWSADTTQGETVNPVPVASRFSDALGVFYVQRHAGANAHQTMHAAVTTDPKFENGVTDIVLQDHIPSTVWMGDNMSQLMGGLPGGPLLAVWTGVPPVSAAGASGCVATVVGALVDVAPAPAAPPPQPESPCKTTGLEYWCTCPSKPGFCTKSAEVCDHACGLPRN
jgi:hypothetical protein